MILTSLFLIFSDYAERQSNVIRFQDVSSEVVEAFTNYVKTGNITRQALSLDMLKFAHMYNIDFLYDYCSKMAKLTINKENINALISVASLLGDEDLLEHIAKFISKNSDSSTMILDILLQNASLK